MYGLFYNEEKIQLTRCYKSIDEVVKDEFGICDTQCWRFHEEIATDEEWKEFIEWLSNQKDFVVKRLELSVDCLDNNENDIQDLEDEFTTKYMREVFVPRKLEENGIIHNSNEHCRILTEEEEKEYIKKQIEKLEEDIKNCEECMKKKCEKLKELKEE